MDIIINNACQTIRRPAAYYAHLLEDEARPKLVDADLVNVAGDSAALSQAVLSEEMKTDDIALPLGKRDVQKQERLSAACRLVDGHPSSRLPALQGFSYPPNLLKPDASAACSSSVDLTHLSPLYWHRDFQDALGLWNHVELRSQSAEKSARIKRL